MRQELQNSQNNSLIRSFGRTKSRRLSDHKNHLLSDLLPSYEVNKINLSEEKICLEIGFGFGDFLFEKAKQSPETLFFGAEPHLNGVVNLLAKLKEEPLPNVKISREDVRILLEKFPDKTFDQIFILFPDPWPKSKHFKRRLITAEFLDKILSPKIKTGSKLTIATDHDSYKTWILAEIAKSKKFSWQASCKSDWQNFPHDWVTTKYQKKAAQEGRVSVIFNLLHND
jgi:tRNA (guanine-N7-)-methyltransferase